MALSGAAFLAAEFLQAAPGARAAEPVPPCTAPILQQKISEDAKKKLISVPDLRSHPLAGSGIEIRLEASDALKQKGFSNGITCALPAPVLHHPLSVELAAIRRDLALAAHKGALATEFPALQTAYAALLRDKVSGVKNPETLKRLRDIGALFAAGSASDTPRLNRILTELWPAITALESDRMTEAVREMTSAQDQLRNALENADKMSDEDLKKAMKEGIDALEKFIKEMKELAKQSGNEELMKKLEEMQKQLDELKKQMEQMQRPDPSLLQQMMDNLNNAMEMQKQAQQGDMKSEQQQAAQEAMQQSLKQMIEQAREQAQMQKMGKDLDKMIRDQQKLMDETQEQLKDPENMKAFQEQLEKYAEALKGKIEERHKQAAPKDQPQPQPQPEADPGALPPETPEQQRLDGLKSRVEEVQKDLQQKREDQKLMTSPEARQTTDKLKRIQQELQQNGPQPEQQPGQDSGESQPQDQQQNGEQKGQKSLEQMLEDLQKQLQKQQGDKGKGLSQRQQDLQKRVQQMMEEMKKMGKGSDKLSKAQKQMQKAQESLQQGEPGEAMPSENEALQSLQEGKQEMQQGSDPGKNPGTGQGKGPGKGKGEKGKSLDNPSAKDGEGNSEEEDLSGSGAVNRGRQILDEIRERLQNGGQLPRALKKYYEELEKGGPGGPQP
jgi:DNA repair exonuclease SbcCD ATPase subunit